MANDNELNEAFINILNNAKDALKEHVENVDNRLIFINFVEYKDRVEISFRDSGGGIPKEYMNRVFEPYFTSKHKSIGTGLGLSLTYKIITERHKGLINVHNHKFEYNGKEYKGSEFIVTLPINTKPREQRHKS